MRIFGKRALFKATNKPLAIVHENNEKETPYMYVLRASVPRGVPVFCFFFLLFFLCGCVCMGDLVLVIVCVCVVVFKNNLT